jgi:hypothetical protein
MRLEHFEQNIGVVFVAYNLIFIVGTAFFQLPNFLWAIGGLHIGFAIGVVATRRAHKQEQNPQQ